MRLIILMFETSDTKAMSLSQNFSRSYWYTVWSAIGSILWFVCPSICPCICNAVYCGSQGRCTGLNVVPACSQQASSYLSLQTLLLKLFSHKTHRKKRVKENANKSFLGVTKKTRVLVHGVLLTDGIFRRSTSRILLIMAVIMLEWTEFGCVHKS